MDRHSDCIFCKKYRHCLEYSKRIKNIVHVSLSPDFDCPKVIDRSFLEEHYINFHKKLEL